jgi:hypothetical protein
MRMSPPILLFSGMIAGTPGHGGATWAVLQYLLGFRRLGFDVRFIEPVADLRGAHDNVSYCRNVMERFGFDDAWALLDQTTGDSVGMSRAELERVASAADLLVNVSGMLADDDLLERVDSRVYLDLDPAFVQFWHAIDGIDMRFDAHTHFVTVGANIGRPGSPIPGCGRDWVSTLPPVVLEEWPFADTLDARFLTTIANWRGYGSIEVEGRHYGQKAHSWRALFELPGRVAPPIQVALAIHPDEVDDLAALRANGWDMVDPTTVADTPESYRRFVQQSWAELCIAKSGYVVSRSGWLSDRSACYLASGRPVIAQDTGLGERVPTGEGLLTFTDTDSAARAVSTVATDYGHHRAAARALAEEHLDADVVLPSLLARVSATSIG